jgi:hypothetical protein
MEGAEIGVREETNEVRLSSLLQGGDCSSLETQIGLEIHCNLFYKALER